MTTKQLQLQFTRGCNAQGIQLNLHLDYVLTEAPIVERRWPDDDEAHTTVWRRGCRASGLAGVHGAAARWA
jgi:hypothetical protein